MRVFFVLFQFCLLAVFHQAVVGTDRRLCVYRPVRKEENLVGSSSVPDRGNYAGSVKKCRLLLGGEAGHNAPISRDFDFKWSEIMLLLKSKYQKQKF